MAVEIEAKMKVADLNVIRARLRDCKAELLGTTNETNIFFDTADKSLLSRDEGLRLRTNRDAASGGETYVITFKAARKSGPLKSREEIELIVDDPGNTIRLFERLGLAKGLSFEKRRETWKLGGCKVELDELPYLGQYVEVEGPDESHVTEVRREIGLADAPMIKSGYISMLTDYLSERKMPSADVTFASAAK